MHYFGIILLFAQKDVTLHRNCDFSLKSFFIFL